MTLGMVPAKTQYYVLHLLCLVVVLVELVVLFAVKGVVRLLVLCFVVVVVVVVVAVANAFAFRCPFCCYCLCLGWCRCCCNMAADDHDRPGSLPEWLCTISFPCCRVVVTCWVRAVWCTVSFPKACRHYYVLDLGQKYEQNTVQYARLQSISLYNQIMWCEIINITQHEGEPRSGLQGYWR